MLARYYQVSAPVCGGQNVETIIIVFVVMKLVIFAIIGPILYKLLGPELRKPSPSAPLPGAMCMYCGEANPLVQAEDQRWEGGELVMVRTYECQSCHLPYWNVERLSAVESK